jgi:multicomponent Na+:H+ antiporter subunit D
MNGLIVVLLLPFLSAVCLALLNGRPRWERPLNAASCVASTVFAFWLLVYVDAHGIQSTTLGGYRAPFGIALVADRLSCIMLCLSGVVGTVSLLASLRTLTPSQERYFFHPLFQILVLGVNWSFVTGDLFNLFIAYEVLLVGSFGCMAVGAGRVQLRQSLVYVAINLVGGALFVVAVALVYALMGTLNFADLAQRSAGLDGLRAATLTAVSMVLLVVFAIKAGTFPVFFWLPDSYPVVPAGVNGYFAGLLTKVGVYSMLRVFVMCFNQEGRALTIDVLLVLSGFTMLLGVIGAVCQWEIRRILAWHSVSQVGYMAMGVGLAADPSLAPAAVVATIVFIVHHGIVKASLFMIGGATELATGSSQLKQMGGAARLAPAAAVLFLASALSLAGLPPFSGFLGKLLLLRTALAGEQWLIVAVAVVTSFVTLMSMLKIWSYAYWGAPRRDAPGAGWRAVAAPVTVLVVATALLGTWAEPMLRVAAGAAREVTEPAAYIAAVLHVDAAADAAAVHAARGETP